jgi:hypothetical protein
VKRRKRKSNGEDCKAHTEERPTDRSSDGDGKKKRNESRETRERGRSILATDHRSTTQGSVRGPLDGAEHLGIQKTVLARSRCRGRTEKNGPVSRYLLCSCNVRGTYEVDPIIGSI